LHRTHTGTDCYTWRNEFLKIIRKNFSCKWNLRERERPLITLICRCGMHQRNRNLSYLLINLKQFTKVINPIVSIEMERVMAQSSSAITNKCKLRHKLIENQFLVQNFQKCLSVTLFSKTHICFFSNPFAKWILSQFVSKSNWMRETTKIRFLSNCFFFQKHFASKIKWNSILFF
jgi:hypothetical protein